MKSSSAYFMSPCAISCTVVASSCLPTSPGKSRSAVSPGVKSAKFFDSRKNSPSVSSSSVPVALLVVIDWSTFEADVTSCSSPARSESRRWVPRIGAKCASARSSACSSSNFHVAPLTFLRTSSGALS